jgi:hypothetical protein
MARVLVLEAADTRIAFVGLDLGEPPAFDWVKRLRENAAKSSGISYVLVTATHTHSGPDIRPAYPAGTPPDWESDALGKIGRAIDDAHQRAVDARIGTGYGRVLIGHNRLRLEPDGSVTWFERNNTMTPSSPVDPIVSVLRLDAIDGTPIAVLVNYACHPVVFGPDNLQYSTDFPGVTEAMIERDLGGMAMFLQGGDGDINPFYAVHPLDQDAPRWKDWTGERLGRETVRVAQNIRTQPESDAHLDFAEDVLDFRPRWRREPFVSAVRRDSGDAMAARVDRWYSEGMHAPVATILINRTIAFMTMPGEPFVDYQIDWRNRCPVEDAFFLGYANVSLGYLPTIRAASLGGYGAGDMATAIQPDAGARIVDHAIVKVYEMLGKLTDLPEELRRTGQD